jgi:hypothetical protein
MVMDNEGRIIIAFWGTVAVFTRGAINGSQNTWLEKQNMKHKVVMSSKKNLLSNFQGQN